MPEYQPPQKENPLFLDPVAFFRITAWVLGLVSLLGIVATAVHQAPAEQWGWLRWGGAGFQFTWEHNALHVILTAASALFGYGSFTPGVTKMVAIAFGGAYLVLGVLGFFVWNGVDGLFALTIALNIVHILLGGWALTTGLLAKS